MNVARELAALTADDIITGNRFGLYRKLTPPFSANEESQSRGSLHYLIMYGQNSNLLTVSTGTKVFFNSDSYFYFLLSGRSAIRDDVVLNCDFTQSREHVFANKNGIYAHILPIIAGNEKTGFMRVGISGQRHKDNFIKS